MTLRVSDWLENPPDYYDMTATYQRLGELRAKVIKLKREIERIEEQVSIEAERPRSNEARSRRLQATSVLKDSLSDFEAEAAIQETLVKSLEYRKSMYASIAYTTKLRLEVIETNE
jgi:hypothetical protein